ncbi:expressed unknown protein [Seminavis robusta]|uniref:Uncharacterized protein n=1 Tax=Seminavis robusta TaxID=568900 RepID=A0A9N8DKU8_9STRA|nr:expressed unknown protein [Seminavis robusta]|eukprot:Sro138_g064630.1 n/a (105) ;mRNA; r:19758-20072
MSTTTTTYIRGMGIIPSGNKSNNAPSPSRRRVLPANTPRNACSRQRSPTRASTESISIEGIGQVPSTNNTRSSKRRRHQEIYKASSSSHRTSSQSLPPMETVFE